MIQARIYWSFRSWRFRKRIWGIRAYYDMAFSAEISQKTFDAVWYKLSAYVYSSVTMPYIRRDLLHGALALRAPLYFRTYVQINGRWFASDRIFIGSLNTPWYSYYWSYFLSTASQWKHFYCTFRILRGNFAFFLDDFIAVMEGSISARYLWCLWLCSSIFSFMFAMCSAITFSWSWYKIGTPICACITALLMVPKLTIIYDCFCIDADFTSLMMSYLGFISFPLMDHWNEFRRFISVYKLIV